MAVNSPVFTAAVPVPIGTIDGLMQAVSALKENIEVQHGTRANFVHPSTVAGMSAFATALGVAKMRFRPI